MTTPPKMRDLAHRLLAYEAVTGKTSEPSEVAALRVYEKLRQSLSAFAGVAAFESLAFRALTQAKSEAPSLWKCESQRMDLCRAWASLNLKWTLTRIWPANFRWAREESSSSPAYSASSLSSLANL